MAAGDHVKTIGSVQQRTSATTLVITVPAGGVAAGNTVFVGVSVTGVDADTVSGVTDTGGNTYTLDVSNAPLNGGSADPKTYLFRGAIVTALAASETITVTLNGSTNNRGKAAVADEYEGTATKDQSASAVGSSTALNSGNVTTTAATETLVGVGGVGGNEALVGDSPWVDRTEANTTGGAAATNASVGLSERMVTATGTFAYSATVTSSSIWRALIATYTFGAGGGPAEGTGSAAVAISTTATGTRVAQGSGLSDVTISVTATGQRTTSATGASSVAVTATASGTSTKSRTGSSSVTATTTATGQRTAKGAAAASIDVSTTAAGQKPAVGAAGSAVVAVTTIGTGAVTHKATAVAAITVTADAQGHLIGKAAGTATIVVTTSAEASKTAKGTGTANVVVTAIARGANAETPWWVSDPVGYTRSPVGFTRTPVGFTVKQ